MTNEGSCEKQETTKWEQKVFLVDATGARLVHKSIDANGWKLAEATTAKLSLSDPTSVQFEEIASEVNVGTGKVVDGLFLLQ